LERAAIAKHEAVPGQEIEVIEVTPTGIAWAAQWVSIAAFEGLVVDVELLCAVVEVTLNCPG